METLSEQLKLSKSYSEQVIEVLSKNKILKGKRGKGGGYRLNEHVIAVTPMNELAKMFNIPDDKSITKKIRHMTISEILEI